MQVIIGCVFLIRIDFRQDNISALYRLLIILQRNLMNGKLSFAQRLAKQENSHEQAPVVKNSSTKKSEVSLTTPQRTRYMQFTQQYNDLKSMLKMFQNCKPHQQHHSPILRPVTPTKNSIDIKIKDQNTKSVQLNQNNEDVKENIWEAKWPKAIREDYQPNKPLAVSEEEPAVIQKIKQIPTEVNSMAKKGIPNHGNTCYINAIVQCLFHLPHFNDYFIDQKYIAQRNGKNKDVVQMYKSLYMNVMRNSSKGQLSTLPLKRAVSSICSLFIDWQQEDAHEFMKKLLNSIHEELNRVKNKPKYKQMFKEVEGESLEKMATAYWNYEKSRDDSYIYDTFCGQTYNNIRCINCNNESETFQNFLDLSIPLTPNAKSLQDLLQDYFEPEKLSDYYLCGKCNKYSKKSTKTVELWRVPRFLIIHLKRSQLQKKNIDPITIPQSLTLKPFMGISNDRTARFCQYSLCGIVMHQGVLQSGHYWANVKQNGKWYQMNDENVREVNSQEFQKDLSKNGNINAYILFYSSLYS